MILYLKSKPRTKMKWGEKHEEIQKLFQLPHPVAFRSIQTKSPGVCCVAYKNERHLSEC